MKTPFKLNPLTYFILLLTAALGLCLATLAVAFIHAPRIGTLAPAFSFQEVYFSEAWSFDAEQYRVQLPEKALIAPVYQEGTFMGMTFQAEGGTVVPRGSTERQKASGGFFMMDNETFLQAKGDTLFAPVEDRTLKNRLILSARQLTVLPSLQAIIHERTFIPEMEKGYAYLEKNNGTALTDLDSIVVENRPWLVIYFGLQIMMALVFAQILSLDLAVPRPTAYTLKSTPSRWEAAACLLSLFLLYTLHGYMDLPAFDPTFNPYAVLTYLGILAVLAILAWRQLIPRQTFGLTVQNLLRSAVIALVLALMLTVFSALKLPESLAVEPLQAAAALFALLFVSSLAKELFWRGFFQTLLERITGRLGGLLLTTALITGFYVLVAHTHSPEVLMDPVRQLELFFFLPGFSLVLGYVFLRSRNILSSTLLHTLVLFVPQALIF